MTRSTPGFTTLLAAGLAVALAGPPARAELARPADQERMWALIQRMQAEIETLKAELQASRDRIAAADARIEATADLVEQVAGASAPGPVAGPAPAAGYGGHRGNPRGRTALGGYGELHYNNLDSKDEVDLHRFVLFAGHRFTDDIRFYSELELEHALSGESENGAAEIEQAFIEMDINDRHRARAGLLLMPAGFINETHEPDTFFGVERPPVEKHIIPTTWREAAVGLNGELAPGWSYDLLLSSGLGTPATGSNAFRIRNGRTQVSQAPAADGALTGRLRYTGIPGVELAATVQHQADLTQGAGIAANLFEAHVDARRGGLGLRALYAGWWLDDGPAGAGPAATGRDRQNGWYVEPSYRFDTPGALPGRLGVFARYNAWDNNAGSAADTGVSQVNIGLNWWPHDNVVFKFDYQQQDDPNRTPDDDGFNLGLGYSF